MNDLKKRICRYENSLWLATTPDTYFPLLKKNEKIEVDVAVVGAGIAGITTALLLKKEGLTVALLESEKVATGVSGYTSGKITAQHILIYAYLTRKFGYELAKQYADANISAILKIKGLIKEYKIDCDFFNKTAFTYAEKDETLKAVKLEVEAARNLGLPADFTDDIELPIPAKGAVYFTGQGQFHPRKYLLALVKEIPGNGSYVFEKTRATGLKEGVPCILNTDKGEILAKDIVISTHFPFYDKPGQYYDRMEAGRIYSFAMKINGPFPDGIFISAEKEIYSFRSQLYRGGELIIAGGQEHITGQVEDTTMRFQLLYEYVKQFFDIDHVEFCWSSQDNNTLDMVPYIGRYLPDSRHLFVATGFNGWGMTHGTISAMIIKDFIAGNSNPWKDIYDPGRFKLLKKKRSSTDNNQTHSEVRVEEYRIIEPERFLSGIKKDEGKIIEIEGKKIALFKTKEGDGIFLDPVCPHMGCLVRFNPAEKSWDCPCHGSRFHYDGRLLNSPALKDLKIILKYKKKKSLK